MLKYLLVTLIISCSQRRKRQKLSRFIPEEKYSDGNRDIELVEISDIKHEYTLLGAQVELIRIQPHFLFVNGKSLLGLNAAVM